MTDPGDYARQVERYLCQKNRGHLIRVVGPAFEMVCGWATTGVPLKIALRGIDRCCERLRRRGPRRRPVRIEFCEADVLDAFDDWRRAVGVAASAGQEQASEPEPRKPALSAHIERAIARLAHARGTGRADSPLGRPHRAVDPRARSARPVGVAGARRGACHGCRHAGASRCGADRSGGRSARGRAASRGCARKPLKSSRRSAAVCRQTQRRGPSRPPSSASRARRPDCRILRYE